MPAGQQDIELFLGDDSNYVKLPNVGGVEISSSEIGSQHYWRFGTDGSLTLPGGNTRLGTVMGSDAIIANSDTTFGVIAQGTSGSAALVWIEDSENFGTSNIAAVYTNPANLRTVRIATGANGDLGPRFWDFGTDGGLTLPAGGTILDTVPTPGITRTKYTGSAAYDVDWYPTASVIETGIVTTISESYEGDADYSFQYVGYFKAPATGTYTFAIFPDDSGRFWIGPNALTGYTAGNANISIPYYARGTTTTSLTADEFYPIRLQWNNDSGPGSVYFRWSNNQGQVVETDSLTGVVFADLGHTAITANNDIELKTNSGTVSWQFGTDGVLNLPDDIGDIKRNGASVLPASNLPIVEITATSTPGYYYGQGNITINVSSTTTPTAVGVLMTSAIDGGYIPANIWVGTNTTGSQTIHYTGWGSGSHYIAQAYVTNTAGTAYSAPVVGQSDYCFAKGTLITLADGTTKPVEQITYADRIMTWDLDNARFTHSRPMWIKKAETADWYSRYTFSDGTELKLVATHRIFNKQAGKFTSPVNAILQKYLTGNNLPVKDETPVGTVSFNSAGEEVTLVSKEHVWETVEHYSLIVDYHMNTFANGIMTGHAQSSIYPIMDMKFVKDDRTVRDISEFEGIPKRFVKGMRLQEQDFDMDYIRNVRDILLSKEIAFSQVKAA
jgi:hypothetical protein